ncbi:fimbria/pilus outer membrane usher protein [Laribacter hongkongensis]|uniref:fimbria/pilus outer membrane usher protein n=1 Tax=Laribacter hongkongensis TaxID=168471 RepID=UPI001EFCBDF9|nr:fimbria/pilus outer membrane usher protein [Laribacter hongkongensis]MCG9076098.1 fimbria/pilus outer membrane usher protein [Laribacter hongkongensis]
MQSQIVAPKKYSLSHKHIIHAITYGMAVFFGLSPAHGQTLLLGMKVNESEHPETVEAYRLDDGEIALPIDETQKTRLKIPESKAIEINSRAYIRASDIPDSTIMLDDTAQTLIIKTPGRNLATANIDLRPQLSTRDISYSSGSFLNYDFFWQDSNGSTRGGGLLEAGIYTPWGTGTSTSIWRHQNNDNQLVRLDSSWRKDFPEQRASLQIGDLVSQGSSWGYPVRFGGIQFSSRFELAPDFIPFSLPVFHGETSLPATAEIYTNTQKLAQLDVAPGPFDILGLSPLQAGQGELQLVVRDLLGRQQVIYQPYYITPRLLQPGTSEFSYGFGAIRKSYGFESNHYGQLMASAFRRTGISPGFTYEWQIEASPHQQTIGAGGAWLLPYFESIFPRVVNSSLAVSHGNDGQGAQLILGMEKQQRSGNFSAQIGFSSRNFTQAGMLSNFRTKNTGMISIGIPVLRQWINIGYIQRSSWQNDQQRQLSLASNIRINNVTQLGISILHGNTGTTVLAGLNFILDSRTTINTDTLREGSKQQTAVQLQKSMPMDNGTGYRIQASDSGRYQAGISWQNPYATLSGDIAGGNGQSGYQIAASGGLSYANNRLFVSRKINESFTVVDTSPFSDIRVYRENQELGRTDETGLLLVQGLHAYQDNRISIAIDDLPLDATVETFERNVVPAWRSGGITNFRLMPQSGFSFRLVDDNGQFVPAGALIQTSDQQPLGQAGLDGKVFIAPATPVTRIIASWDSGSCYAMLPGTIGAALPDLGTLSCKKTSSR